MIASIGEESLGIVELPSVTLKGPVEKVCEHGHLAGPDTEATQVINKSIWDPVTGTCLILGGGECCRKAGILCLSRNTLRHSLPEQSYHACACCM